MTVPCACCREKLNAKKKPSPGASVPTGYPATVQFIKNASWTTCACCREKLNAKKKRKDAKEESGYI